MTNEQMRTVEAAIDEVIGKAHEALPDGNSVQHTEWIVEHLPPFTPDIVEALAHETVRDLIRSAACNMGVTLQG